MESLLNYFGFDYSVFEDITLSTRLATRGIKTQVVWREETVGRYKTQEKAIGVVMRTDDRILVDSLHGVDLLQGDLLVFVITACYYHMLSGEVFTYLFNKTVSKVSASTVKHDVMFHDLVFCFDKEDKGCRPTSPLRQMKHIEVWTLGTKIFVPDNITQMIDQGLFGYVKHHTKGPTKGSEFCIPDTDYDPKFVRLMLNNSIVMKARYQLTPFTLDAACTVSGLSLESIIERFTKGQSNA